jgi:hypothetical protein
LWAIGFKIVLVAILDSFLHYRHKRKKAHSGVQEAGCHPISFIHDVSPGCATSPSCGVGPTSPSNCWSLTSPALSHILETSRREEAGEVGAAGRLASEGREGRRSNVVVIQGQAPSLHHANSPPSWKSPSHPPLSPSGSPLAEEERHIEHGIVTVHCDTEHEGNNVARRRRFMRGGETGQEPHQGAHSSLSPCFPPPTTHHLGTKHACTTPHDLVYACV